MASVISGFSLPLREEHVDFFRTVIIPLHKVQTCQTFHEELQRCAMLFLAKDPALYEGLMLGILRCWPFANSAKEVLFLSELLEVVKIIEISSRSPVLEKFLKRVVKCIVGQHLQVADLAMCFFENEKFIYLIKENKAFAYPLIVPVIERLSSTHWHQILQEGLVALKEILCEADAEAYKQAKGAQSPLFYLVEEREVY